ncbi:MAG: hypothetical protein QM730_02600 [Anaerolineales bacterium]
MHLEAIIAQFGYPALIIGLLLEGETVLVLGAFMAHRGYLNLPLVIALGCVVSFAADQFFFWMGRTQGSRFLESRPRWNVPVGFRESAVTARAEYEPAFNGSPLHVRAANRASVRDGHVEVRSETVRAL